jgi:hypothetical protein
MNFIIFYIDPRIKPRARERRPNARRDVTPGGANLVFNDVKQQKLVFESKPLPGERKRKLFFGCGNIVERVHFFESFTFL